MKVDANVQYSICFSCIGLIVEFIKNPFYLFSKYFSMFSINSGKANPRKSPLGCELMPQSGRCRRHLSRGVKPFL